jgi:hypothetical protein
MRDVKKGHLFRGHGYRFGNGGTRVGLGIRSKKEGAVEANLPLSRLHGSRNGNEYGIRDVRHAIIRGTE